MGNLWTDYDKRLKVAHFENDNPKDFTIKTFGDVKAEFESDPHAVQPVLYLAETTKYFELNESNRAKLGELFGDEKPKCIGKRIRIRAQKVRGGKIGLVIIGEAPPLKPSVAKPATAKAPTQGTTGQPATNGLAPKPGNESTDPVMTWEDLTGAMTPVSDVPGKFGADEPALAVTGTPPPAPAAMPMPANYNRDERLSALRAERNQARKIKLMIPELGQDWLATATPQQIEAEINVTRSAIKQANRERLMAKP